MEEIESVDECALFGDCGDDLVTAVFNEFIGISHRHRQLMFKIFSRYHLHPSQGFCIRMLSLAGEITQSELAEAMMLSRPTITRILQRMEREGLVTRRPGDADQRQTLVVLTERGRSVHQQIGAVMSELVAATISQLSVDDRRQLARILPIWRTLADEALA